MTKYILFITVPLLFGCKKPASTVCSDQSALCEQTDFKIGTAVDISLLFSDVAYAEIARKQFNSITPENTFKPTEIHPSENGFNWTEADQLQEYCRLNNKRLHGHTLIWHQQLPGWMEQFNGNAEEWDTMMKTHIQEIVRHFKGKVSGWDVVNEAFNEDGTLRNNIWRQHIGDLYLEKAFNYAHEADPAALLFYNDYGLESNSTKRTAVLSHFKNLKMKGVRIDGIGMQMHLNIPGSDPGETAAAMVAVCQHDFLLHISEMDISVNPLNKTIKADKNLLEKQADLFGKIAFHYRQIPGKYRYGMTFWGISDKHTWIRSYFNRNDYPLLYDDDYSPKPAYCKLKEVL